MHIYHCINTIKRYVYNNDASIIDNRYSLCKYLVLNKQTMSQKMLMIIYTAMYFCLNQQVLLANSGYFSDNSQFVGQLEIDHLVINYH